MTITQTKLTWQKILSEAITSPDELFLLKINPTDLHGATEAHLQFKTFVPRTLLTRITPNNLEDPILKQVLPQSAEVLPSSWQLDPLQESDYSPVPGLLHKYHGRVLLITTPACSINCRFCFRRHFPYASNTVSTFNFTEQLTYIRNHSDITEVILSGGDPLMAKDSHLAHLLQALDTISHIKIIRFHTRFPIIIPERITDELCTLLSQTRFKITIVLHCNHPQEIDTSVAQMLYQLKKTGITVLNQSVILKGINDCANILAQLSYQLFEHGVLPYYLHVLDNTKGVQHFAVEQNEIQHIYKTLLSLLPGYLVPKLVQEIPGIPHKSLVLI